MVLPAPLTCSADARSMNSETPAKAHAVAIVEAEASDDKGRAGENEEARAARGRLENPVAEANEKPPPRAPRAPPRTATEFERGCASLRGDPAALLAFVSSVDDAALPGVLKHSVSATILRAYGIAFGRVVGAPGSPATSDAANFWALQEVAPYWTVPLAHGASMPWLKPYERGLLIAIDRCQHLGRTPLLIEDTQ